MTEDSELLKLFPSIQPYRSHRLGVGDGHDLYIEECGSADGLPVVFLHGGPGAGCEPLHRRFFDPQLYRIVLFDQRGCGRSTPAAALHANTIEDLIDDIEKIRKFLSIEKWVVFGGSWGATLALAYAQRYARQVLTMILRGVFLGRQQDIDWFYRYGASQLFPEAWQAFVAPIPVAEQDDLIAAYYRRLIGQDELQRLRVAKTWSAWEAATLSVHRIRKPGDYLGTAQAALSLACIEAHYFINHCFLDNSQLLNNCSQIIDIKGIIIQGRYDVITPAAAAWQLAQSWSAAELRIVNAAGHAASEPGIIDALITATNAVATKLR